MAASAVLMMVSKVISHGCIFLIVVVLARFLDRTDFGTFNQVWLVNRSLLYLFALGLPVSAYYFLPRLPQAKLKSFIIQTMLSLTLLALPFSISMYLLADTLAVHFQNPGLEYYLRLFALYPLVMLPTSSTEAILIGLGRTKNAAIFEVTTKIAMIAAVAAAAMRQRLDLVFKVLVGYGIAQSILGTWMVWQPVQRAKLHFSFADLKSQIGYAAPYGFAALVGTLNYQMDKVWAALFYPPAIFALYAAGAFEIPLAGVTSGPVVSVIMGELTKRFTSGDTEGFLELWHQSMLKLALPVFAVATFFMVFSETIVVTMFSSQYLSSVGPFRIYLLFLPMHITALYQVLASLGETKFFLKAQVLATIVNIVLGYILIRKIGWLGPALSALTSGYLLAIFLLREIRNRLKVSLPRLVPWMALAKVGLVAIIAALCSLPIALLRFGSVWKLGLGSVIFVAIYLIGNLKTNSISTTDLQTLRSWIFAATQSAVRPALESEIHE